MTDDVVRSGALGVRDGLQLIEQLIRLEIDRLRVMGVPAGQDDYRGLYLSDEEINRLLGLSTPPRNGKAARIVELEDELTRARRQLVALTQHAQGPLQRLLRLTGVSPFELGCLLLCLAPESDLRFERLLAYVQDDVTKRRPRVELAFRLLVGSLERRSARRAFAAASPLRHFHLLMLHDEPGQAYTPLLAQSMALDPRVAGFLLGQTALDERLRPHAELLSHRPDKAAWLLPPELAERLKTLPTTALEEPVIHLSGQRDMARLAAGQLAQGAQLKLLRVNFPPLVVALGLDLALSLSQREAAFQSAALWLSDLHRLKPEEADDLRSRLTPEAPGLASLTLLSAEAGFAWPGLTVHLTPPDFTVRRALWEHQLGAATSTLEPAVLEALADKFRLTTEGIAAAARAARGSARWRNPTQPQLTPDDLYTAARAQSTPILHTLARKIAPHYTWDDIILPADTFQQLQEMCAYVEHRHVVYERWGFERKLAMGKGLMALFAGPSGTGKTMAADILARALGLDLYKIDLSGVVSKYIGETEKNLNHIFAEAETSNAILFFDEADALFGKRSEVKDSHDRYANIEIAFLLQKMEEYAGVVILATNLKMNLDEAFLRRMHFVVDFPVPEEDDRRRIWETTLPPDLPLAADVDLAFLARKFKLTGGHIRNIVLSAAFLAAAEGQGVTMQHLVQATRREFQKLGRMITPADFESYYPLLSEAAAVRSTSPALPGVRAQAARTVTNNA